MYIRNHLRNLLFCIGRLNQKLHFADIMSYIRGELTDEQWHSLTIVRDGEALDFSQQVLMLYADNRYSPFMFKEEALDLVKEFLGKYKFIFFSGWSPDKIRHKFISALMEVISIGSAEYLVKWDVYTCYYFGYRSQSVNTRNHAKYIPYIRFLLSNIQEDYPNLPASLERRRFISTRRKYESVAFVEALAIRYAYFLGKAIRKGKIDPEKYDLRFFKENKWNLERLNKGCSFFSRKYRNRIFQNINRSLGMKVDLASSVRLP